MSYFGRGGWYYESIQSLSKGETYLREDYGVELGEPVSIIGTGMTTPVFNKRILKSYDTGAGLEPAIGVSLDTRYASSGISAGDILSVDELKALRPDLFQREITILMEGVCMVKNTHSSTTIEIGDTVVPSNGGCEKMTTTGQYSLGVSIQRILPLHRGLIKIKPDYEKPIV